MKEGAATGTKIILPRGMRIESGSVTWPVTATISALPFRNSSVFTGVITRILCFGKNLMYSKKSECEIETKVFGTMIFIMADSLSAFCSIFSKISSYRPSISSTKGKISSPISVKRKGRERRSNSGTLSSFSNLVNVREISAESRPYCSAVLRTLPEFLRSKNSFQI